MTPREQALVEAARAAAEALCNHACHAGETAPCIRSAEQCRDECGKVAGDAFLTLFAALSQYEDKETDNG